MPERPRARAQHHRAMPMHQLAKRVLVADRHITRDERGIRLAIERSVGMQCQAPPMGRRYGRHSQVGGCRSAHLYHNVPAGSEFRTRKQKNFAAWQPNRQWSRFTTTLVRTGDSNGIAH
jgi:hypothetical protein